MNKVNRLYSLAVIFALCACKHGKKEPNTDTESSNRKKNNYTISNHKYGEKDMEHSNVGTPKEHYVQLIPKPELKNLTNDLIKKAITEANGDSKKLAENLRQLWNSSIANSPKIILSSTISLEIANGSVLPTELAKLLSNTQDSINRTDEDNILCGVAVWAALLQNDLLTDFAKTRANELPPTSLDIAIYEALGKGIKEFSTTRGKLSYAPFNKWKDLSKSTNPIYRLLALKAGSLAVTEAAWNVDPESSQFNKINEIPKLEFYISYLSEKDPAILAYAIRSLSFVAHPDAYKAIEKFYNEQSDRGNKTMIEEAANAMRTNRIISK